MNIHTYIQIQSVYKHRIRHSCFRLCSSSYLYCKYSIWLFFFLVKLFSLSTISKSIYCLRPHFTWTNARCLPVPKRNGDSKQQNTHQIQSTQKADQNQTYEHNSLDRLVEWMCRSLSLHAFRPITPILATQNDGWNRP